MTFYSNTYCLADLDLRLQSAVQIRIIRSLIIYKIINIVIMIIYIIQDTAKEKIYYYCLDTL